MVNPVRLRAAGAAPFDSDPGSDQSPARGALSLSGWPAPGVRELPCDGGYRALYEVIPDTGREETAGDVLVLRVFGPGQDRGML